MNRIDSSRAPPSSNMRVPRPMVPVISMIRPTRTVFMLSAMTPRSRMLMRRRRSREKSVAIVMKPRPPICMSSRMTAWPKPDQYVAVSTRTSPVTQEALTAVNSAVTKPVASPLSEAAGSISNMVPAAMTVKKPSAIVWTYESCLIFIARLL